MNLKTFFLVSQKLSFRLKKQTSKNVPDTTFKTTKNLLHYSKFFTFLHNVLKMLQKLLKVAFSLYPLKTSENLQKYLQHFLQNLVKKTGPFFDPLSANPTKWSNTIKQFIGCCRRKTIISNPLIRTCMCAYQGVRILSFSQNFAYVLNRWPPNYIFGKAFSWVEFFFKLK